MTDTMVTLVSSAAQESAEAQEAQEAPEAPAETAPAPRLTREAAITAFNTAYTAWADDMILARRLTLGTSNVKSKALCKSGTEQFMVRGHLQPTTGEHRSRYPVDEPADQAAEAEERIRTWVRAQVADMAMEDYTATGLMKRVPKITEAHEKWRTGFRDLIIAKYKETYIHLDRMQEVLPQLGMAPYEPRMYAHISLNMDYHAPAGSFGGSTQTDAMRQHLRDRLNEALREIMGPQALMNGCSYGFADRNISISMDTWRNS